ncbi:hypothetical protein [Tropicibacter sp. S64]|uniref:hypothetical protein n=1 Tax=Tropicibacter sp. S64 TaxID=3415122 RepID=UPI003C7DDF20
MKRKILTSFVLMAAMIGASSVSAQQQQDCDSNQSTPQTDDDCTILGGLWGAGDGVGIAIATGAAVGIIAAAGGGGGGGGGETPNTFVAGQ